MTKRAPNKRRLNDLFLKKLKPQERPFLIWDTIQRGLAVQVQPTGQKSWKAIYSFHSRPRWYHIADAAAVGLSDARKLAGQIMFKVAGGKDPQAERRAARGADTFEDLATRYRAYSERKNKSWKQADGLVRRHLLPRWAKLSAADVSRSDVETLITRITAPIVANQVLASASAIFAWAIKQRLAGVMTNPCHGVERHATRSRERVLSDSEISKFWTAFDTAGLTRSQALKMILLSGQRPGEVSHMRTEHIEDGWWTMPGDAIPALGWPGTKNGTTHRVWLPKGAQKILTEMDATGMIFAGPRGRIIDLSGAMRMICKDLGIERATPHDLRRTHGTTVTALGFGRDAMNRVQNHKEGGIASVYDRHQYAEENKRIMEAVSQKIMGMVEGEPDNVVAFSGHDQTRLKVPR
jgi:integrase